MDLKLIENTKASKIYGMMEVKERYYCNFGINPDHPFFMGTLFVPQALSKEGKPHPLLNAFVKAAMKVY